MAEAYQSHLENYLVGRLASYAQQHHRAGNHATLLEALQPSGDMSYPASSDFVVTQAITAGFSYRADMGKGGFTGINPAGGLYVSPSGHPTRMEVTGDHRLRYFSIDAGFVAEALEEADGGRPLVDFGRLHRSCLVDGPISSLISTLWLACEQRDRPAALLADHAALYVVLRLAGLSLQAPQIVRGGLSPWQVRRVTEAIQEMTDDSLSLTDLAALAGLSVYHFARAFKQTLGVPPHRYQRALRLERARALLEQSEASVTEIALSVGFESSQSLARAFARDLHISPSEYRRSRR